MIVFPGNTRITTTPSFPVAGSSKVCVYDVNDQATLDQQCQFYKERLCGIELDAEKLERIKSLANIRISTLRICVSSLDDLHYIDRLIQDIKGKNTAVILKTGKDILRVVNYLTGFRIKILISPVENEIFIPVLDELIDFYMHQTTVRSPIEPFHSILQTMINLTRITLWDILQEKPGFDFYITGEGKITLSKRWAENGRYFGSTNQSWDTLRTDKLFQKIQNPNKLFFAEQSECVFCPHFTQCGGYFKIFNADADCKPWKKVFATLQEEIQNVRRILTEYGKTEKTAK